MSFAHLNDVLDIAEIRVAIRIPFKKGEVMSASSDDDNDVSFLPFHSPGDGDNKVSN